MGCFRLIPLNDVAEGAVPAEGIVLWETAPYQLGRATTKTEGFPLPQNLSQISSRHCSLRPSGEVCVGREGSWRKAAEEEEERERAACARSCRRPKIARACALRAMRALLLFGALCAAFARFCTPQHLSRCPTWMTLSQHTTHSSCTLLAPSGRRAPVDALRHEHQRHLHQRELGGSALQCSGLPQALGALFWLHTTRAA